MFCPKCGKADQSAESYCRQCGVFLPDPFNPQKREIAPEEHLKANTFLSVLTILTSFTLAALLYLFLGFRNDTPVIVYITAGFLIAMGGWHIQTFIRTRKLKKQWKRRTPAAGIGAIAEPAPARELEPANIGDVVPASVTEDTTRKLKAEHLRST